MKCKVCDGSGITKGYDAILGKFFDMKCFACDGSGEVDHYEEEKEEPLTNEEWFCQLPTYKKAAIMTYIYDALELDKYIVGKHVVVEEWLKQPHKEE